MKRVFCYVNLTCSASVAEKISQRLLEKRLVACAKFIPIKSMYAWHGEIKKDTETLLVFESAEDLFAEIESHVSMLHSYDTFVLSTSPMTHLNAAAISWLEANLVPFTRKSKLI